MYKELLQLTKEYKVVSAISRDTLDQEVEDTILLLSDVILSLCQDSEDQLSGTYTVSLLREQNLLSFSGQELCSLRSVFGSYYF